MWHTVLSKAHIKVKCDKLSATDMSSYLRIRWLQTLCKEKINRNIMCVTSGINKDITICPYWEAFSPWDLPKKTFEILSKIVFFFCFIEQIMIIHTSFFVTLVLLMIVGSELEPFSRRNLQTFSTVSPKCSSIKWHARRTATADIL